MKNAFYFILKALFVLKIFKFLSGIFVHVEKTFLCLIRKIRLILNFDFTAWLTKNYNTHTNQRQPDNDIWSVNRTSQEKYFSLKIMQKMRQGN